MTRRSDVRPTSPGIESKPRQGPDSLLLDALFSEAPIGLGFWDRELRYQRVNSILAAMNGVPVEEHVGRRVSEVLPRLGPQLEELFGRILATGEPVLDRHITGETPALPGVERHWVADYFPVAAADEPPVGIAATVVEVTDAREAAARARRAQRREHAIDAQLRAVYAALPVGVGFLTPDLRYDRVNEALARMNGRSVEDHLGRTVHEILGEHGRVAAKVVSDVVERREPVELELALSTPVSPDEERVFEATFFPVFAPDAELLGVGAVVRDVTDRKRLLHEAVSAREAAERQREAAEAASRRASFLARVTRRMSASLDYEATLQEVVAAAVPDIADWGAITVVGPGRRIRLLATSGGGGDLPREPSRPGAGDVLQAARVIATGEPVIVTDAPTDAADLAPGVEVRHYGTWPIQAPEGQVIGALSLALGSSGRRFSASDMELARAVATRAGLHITNARLHTERSQIAATLQASLLPRKLPEIPGVELASAFLPAGTENLVGGDFFDVFPSGDGVWTAVLGDVSGKGAQAAAITAAARHTLRAAALMSSDPGSNLALLDRLLWHDFEGSQFCTAVYVRLCPLPESLAVRMANGGHPPAIVVRKGGTVEPVPAGRGPVIGVGAGLPFEETSAELRQGDVLLLHTDGVTEIRRGGMVAGERELHHVLSDPTHRSATQIVDAVTARAVELHDGAPSDDITLLAIGVP